MIQRYCFGAKKMAAYFSLKIYPQGSRKGEMAQMNCESVSFGF
ncbi:hypothetical protein HMPREF1553_01857 [Porphyromonas gingivalis F0568]|nr:hypothetical protein HMPREF1553_01857 [Porphyromonas gingivalis F0568]